MEINDRIWYDLIYTNYQAIYSGIFNRGVRNFSDRLNIFTAVIASASVGGWAIWDQIPEVWAVIIASSQLVNLCKPYIKKFRDYEIYHQLQLYYEERFFELDMLWLQISLGELTEKEIKDNYKAIYQKYFNLSKKFLKTSIEENKIIERKAISLWNKNLAKYGITE